MIRQRGRIRRLAAGVASLLLALQSATPAWSQRRGSEPQANPEFQSGGEGPTAGGPVGGEPQGGGTPADEGQAADEAGADEILIAELHLAIHKGKDYQSFIT